MNATSKKRYLFLFAAAVIWRLILIFLTGNYNYFEGITVHYVRAAQYLAMGDGFVTDEPGKAEVKERQKLAGHLLEPADYPPLVEAPLDPVLGYLPGYSAWLALFFKFGISHFLPIRTFQILLDSLACLLLVRLGACMFGEGESLWIGWFYALWPPLAISSIFILADALTIPLTVVMTYCVWKAVSVPERSICWWAAASVAVVLQCYVRPNALLMPVFLAAVAWCTANAAWKKSFLVFSLALGILMLSLFPWAARNHRVTGSWIWSTASAGVNLWSALGERSNPWNAAVDDTATREMVEAQGYRWHTPEADAFLKRRFMAALREDPVFYASTCVLRLGKIFFARQFWGMVPEVTAESWSQAAREKGIAQGTMDFMRRHPGPFSERLFNMLCQSLDWAIAGFAFVGMGRLIRLRRYDVCATASLPLVYYYAVSPVIHVEARYVLPVYVSYAILAMPVIRALWQRHFRQATPLEA